MRLVSTGSGAVLVALVLLVAAACGGSGSAAVGTAPDAGPDGSTPAAASAEAGLDADATDGAPADSAGCPLTYTAATGSCQALASTLPNGGEPACVYPEGTCRCVTPRCGGVVIPIEDSDAATSLVWRCTAPRTDGCPEQNPAGQACNDAKKTCSYPNGCCTDFATCNDGRWATRPGACPL